MKYARITGTGMYVPPRIVTNDDLAKIIDTSDEWIQQRSGIKQRHYVEDHVGASDIGYESSIKAIEAAGIKAEDLDLILFATLSPDYYFPASGVFLQDKLGLSTTPAIDIRGQCTGFIYALSVARSFIVSGEYNRILVCAAEIHSNAIDFTTRGRDLAVLFGDGSAAVVVESSDSPDHNISSAKIYSQGKYRDKLKLEYPGMRRKPAIRNDMLAEDRIHPFMDGRFVFKNAVTRMPEVIREVLEINKYKPEDVDHFILHQANLRINEAALKELGLPADRAYNNIQNYGNCSAASIPMCLDECVRSGRIKPGDLVCLAAFGAGFTWGSCLIRW